MLRAAPWRALVGTAGGGLLLGVLALVASRPVAVVVLQLSWIVLAAGCALALDEPAAAAVDACPVGRGRQLAVRATAAAVPVTGGLLALLLHEQRSWRLALQLLGCCVLGFTAAALLRTRLDEPGEPVAVALLALLAPLAVYAPLGRRLPLFRTTDTGALLWAGVLAASALSLASTGCNGSWRSWVPRPPASPTSA